MDSKVNYAAVGVFVLVLGALLIAIILWLATGAGTSPQYALYLSIVQESVAGLNLDAPVKYMGVDVGKVRKIEINPNNPQEVNLLFAIKVGTPIKQDTEAVLKTQGLTGIAFVELSGSSSTSKELLALAGAAYPVIRTKPSLSARLENVLTSVLANLDRTAANVNALFDQENRLAIKQILENTALVTKSIALQKTEIERLIQNAAKTADSTARTAPQLDPMLTRISKAAEAVETMASEARLASTGAKQTFDEAGTGMRRLNSDTLPEIERLLSELSSLSASLKRLSEQTERNPESLLRGRQALPLGPGEKSEHEKR